MNAVHAAVYLWSGHAKPVPERQGDVRCVMEGVIASKLCSYGYNAIL
jgi:hypothetical protein